MLCFKRAYARFFFFNCNSDYISFSNSFSNSNSNYISFSNSNSNSNSVCSYVALYAFKNFSFAVKTVAAQAIARIFPLPKPPVRAKNKY